MRIDPDTCRDPDLLAAEVRRLRSAIAALADQDATLSVCDGSVTVTMDATLTVEEREAVEWYSGLTGATRPAGARSTLRNLLDRMA